MIRQPSRQPSRHCTVELQALPARIGHVRRIISAQLRYWHLDALIDPAALGVTELLANVHRHARPSKRCSVELYALLGQLTVSVHDRDPRLPRVRAAESWETCGRGLALIAALSASWGMHPDADGGGKVVWFTLPAPTAAPGAPAAPTASLEVAGSAHWEPISVAPETPEYAPLSPSAPQPLVSAPLVSVPPISAPLTSAPLASAPGAPEPSRSAPPAPEPLRSAPLAPAPSIAASADPLPRTGDATVG